MGGFVSLGSSQVVFRRVRSHERVVRGLQINEEQETLIMANPQQPFRLNLLYGVRQTEHEYGEFASGQRGYTRWQSKATAMLGFDLPGGQSRLVGFLRESGGGAWLVSDLDSEDSTVEPDEISDEGGGGGNAEGVFTDEDVEVDDALESTDGEIIIVRREADGLPEHIEVVQAGDSEEFESIDALLKWMGEPLDVRYYVALKSGGFPRGDLEVLAEAGDSSAMRLLAYELKYEDDPPSDSQAAAWLIRAAELGDVEAITDLGKSYFLGEGVSQDRVAARRYLQAAVDREHPDAFGWLGDLESDSGETWGERARSIFERGATLGDARSQYRLGVFLIEAEGPKTQRRRGAELVKKAADWGLHMAMLRRAELLLDGELVEQDEQEAKSLLEAAAEEGCEDAMTRLGEVWHFAGDDNDEGEASRWYEAAVECGCPVAHWRLADLLLNGDEEELHKPRAYSLYLFAVKNGVEPARRRLTDLHEGGFGTKEERGQFEELPPEAE